MIKTALSNRIELFLDAKTYAQVENFRREHNIGGSDSKVIRSMLYKFLHEDTVNIDKMAWLEDNLREYKRTVEKQSTKIMERDKIIADLELQLANFRGQKK